MWSQICVKFTFLIRQVGLFQKLSLCNVVMWESLEGSFSPSLFYFFDGSWGREAKIRSLWTFVDFYWISSFFFFLNFTHEGRALAL